MVLILCSLEFWYKAQDLKIEHSSLEEYRSIVKLA